MTILGSLRRFAPRSRWDRGLLRRGRLPLVLLLAAGLAAVTAAVSTAATPNPGLRFAQAGHWVASPSLGTVFHINGAARTVDARADVSGLEPGSQVVQGDTSGYVVGRARIVEFGKSSLSVERTLTTPSDERPVAVETAGGPYLVYRQAGRVVRLGETPATIPAGGALGEPVATRDGTLWLHRTDSGVLCRLSADTDRISCPASAPVGHAGALSVVDERPVFLDTETDTLSLIADDGLGKPTRIGVDVPPTARVAPADVAGRIAILDPTARRMHLVDATRLDGKVTSPAVSVDLPDGDYSAPTVSRSAVVLLDRKRGAVLTYGSDGRQQGSVPVPPENGEPVLSRGEDERVYVDGPEGRHVLVVDHNGAVGSVPVAGDGKGNPTGTPVPPDRTPAAPPADRTPETPRRPDPPAPPERRDDTPTPARKAVPASPPGAPPGLKAAAQGANLRVTWGAAASNGASVSRYRISWARASGGGGGSATKSGGTRSISLTGLSRGVAYRVTVAAENSAGRGSAASVRATIPQPTRTVTVSRGSDTTYEDDCHAPDCAYMRIVMRGFKPNTNYHIKPSSDQWPNYNPGGTHRTDAQGNLTLEDYPFDAVGQHVWVTVDGVRSNRFLWRAG
ncbi:fibronectin type III domain-containing protein [Plantactinospora sp. CA-290183]|uniref:fibronectin type III domain-containing protein n=1 Tax=Plantactinospora sp. CA-290183 TaxID=3240006 RepID=UPI003D93660E